MKRQTTDDLPEIYSDLLQGQVSYLYKHLYLNFWGNLTLAVMITLAFFNHVDNQDILIAWFAVLTVSIVIRFLKNQQFKPQQKYTKDELVIWKNWYIFFTLAISLLWGLSALLIFPSAESAAESYQFLLILALSTILLTSTPTLTASRNVFYLQVVFLLLPIILILLWQDDPKYRWFALMLVFMSITVAATSHYVHNLLLKLHHTQQQAQAQAHTDQVTQLANRRHFDKYFKVEWRRAARDYTPLSLLMVDIDYFKAFNDEYGHQEGDYCLRRIAAIMQSVARRSADLVARHGGEEFVVLLPNTSPNDALLLAENLREKIINEAIAHKGSDIADVVTASIGAAGCIPILKKNSDTGEDVTYPAQLLLTADKAMYRAKEKGRNRVELGECGVYLARKSASTQTQSRNGNTVTMLNQTGAELQAKVISH
ncbi:MAG: diguanylate cyclase [bacterium]